jgi:putative transposase
MPTKSFKYRLYPTRSQRGVLRHWLDASRWVYNKTLEIRKDTWEAAEEALSLYDTNLLLTVWKKKRLWLRSVDAQVLQNAQRRVDLAFQAFFRRAKTGEAPGYPRFRGRDRYDSFCFPQYPGGCELDGSTLKIGKIGTIRLNLHRPVEGRIKTTTLKVTSTGKWFVYFVAEVEATKQLPSSKTIGLDLGLEHFAMASNGKVIRNPRFFTISGLGQKASPKAGSSHELTLSPRA